MRFLLSMSILFILSGCVRYVDVPVWVCPAPKMPVRMELTSTKLTKESGTDNILRSLVYDISYLSNYADQLETILLGYEQRQEVSQFK